MYIPPYKVFALVLATALIISITAANADSIVTYPPMDNTYPNNYLAGNGLEEDQGETDFLQLDHNADGSLSKEEYLGSVDPELRTSDFHENDVNQDGQLSAAEYRRLNGPRMNEGDIID